MEGGALAAIFEFRVAEGRRVAPGLPDCRLPMGDPWMHQKQEMVRLPRAPGVVGGGFVTLLRLRCSVAPAPRRSPGAVQRSLRWWILAGTGALTPKCT